METIIKKIKEEWNDMHYSLREDLIFKLKHLVLDLEEQIKRDDQTFYGL